MGLVRERNEDAFLADDARGLYVVADGMGGHAAGDVAAQLAVDAVAAFVDETERPTDGRAVITFACEAVQAANRAVWAKAASEPRLQGMGCTLTAVLFADTFAAVAHVGDSRCYIWRDGDVQQLTHDHTMVALMVERGLLSVEEAQDTDIGHVLARAVGIGERVEVESFGVELEPGDHLLLASDGLTSHITSPAWLASQLERDNLDAVAEDLIAFAKAQGGEDNITAVLVTIDGEVISSGKASGRGR